MGSMAAAVKNKEAKENPNLYCHHPCSDFPLLAQGGSPSPLFSLPLRQGSAGKDLETPLLVFSVPMDFRVPTPPPGTALISKFVTSEERKESPRLGISGTQQAGKPKYQLWLRRPRS